MNAKHLTVNVEISLNDVDDWRNPERFTTHLDASPHALKQAANNGLGESLASVIGAMIGDWERKHAPQDTAPLIATPVCTCGAAAGSMCHADDCPCYVPE
jgi:hypothetical protein